MGYCHECGTKQESSDLFCFSCGYKLPQDQNKNNLVDSEIESCVTSTKGLEIRDIMVEESKDFVNESAKTHFNPSNESSYKRFTVNEFAQEIRMLYPGGYNDLSDSNLVDLWLKKYPEDTNKII